MLEKPFKLISNYAPQGDQAQAIAKLMKSLGAGNRHQTLLGVTGSGKTFTMANVVAQLNRPTLVMPAQQDAGGAALLGVPEFLSRSRQRSRGSLR